MNHKFIITMAVALLSAHSLFAMTPLPDDSTLRRYAASMLMVGFKGDVVTDDSDAARYVRDLHVGAIVLFDVDLTGDATIGSRNITGKQQLSRLTAKLKSMADSPLLIALDQEGGKVARLKPQYGYKATVAAQHLGDFDNEDTTRRYTRQMAEEIAQSGVNVNLAPVVDILNPQCPPLGKIQRCFSTDPAVIVRQARWMIDEHHRQGVLCTLKHFPGHGNAINDSHYGLVDVTRYWSEIDLEPFKLLIADGQADLIMTAHIFNNHIDPDYPATLSRKTIDGVLRRQLGYDGVVVTDDLYMQGIIDNYKVEEAVVLSINAGADLICVGNNISTGFESERPFLLVDMIVKAVKEGRIPWERLQQSHRRLLKLQAKLQKQEAR